LNCTAIFFFPFNPRSGARCQVSGARFCVEPSGVSGFGRLKPDAFDSSLETLLCGKLYLNLPLSMERGDV